MAESQYTKVGVSSPGGQSDSAEKKTGNRSTKHLLVVEVRVDSLVDPAWNQGFWHASLAKVGDFLRFGFEIFQAGMGQNEVQNQQPSSDQFIGKAAAIAQVIAVESTVDLA